MGKLLKNYSYNLAYQFFSMFVPLITAPYLLRTLGANGTGIYGYVNSVTAIVTTISMLGIYSFGSRQIAYVRDDEEKLQKAFNSVFTARIVLSLFGIAIYILVTAIIGRYIVYFVVYFPYVLGFFVDCTWVYVGLEDMRVAVIKNFAVKLLSVIGIFIFIHTEKDTWKYLLILGGSTLISNLFAYTQLGKYIKKPKLDNKDVWNNIMSSAYLFLPNLAYTIYLQCDKIMIENITGQTSQVSFYDYSEKIVTIPLAIITVLNTVFMPRIANEYVNDNHGEIERLINQTLKISMFLSIPMAFGIMLLSRKLIPWYLGEKYIDVANSIIIISPIIITNSFSSVFGSQYFTATNQISILLKSQVSAVMINIICNIILIPHFQIYGAGIATVTSSLLCSIIQYHYIKYQLKLKGLFITLIKYTCVSISMGFVINFFTLALDATPMTNLVQIVIGVIVYFGICYIMKDDQAVFVADRLRKLIRK